MRFPFLRVMGGVFLVSGTAIGAGMLALPVVSAEGGFFPALLLYLLCALFSGATGLLFVELSLSMPQGANLISMASRLLGPFGKGIAWVLYLFLFYCLTVAYISGGGRLLLQILPEGTSYFVGALLFTLLFGSVVYRGTLFVNRINSLLMIGLIGSYFLFVIAGSPKVTLSFLQQVAWGKAILALPVIFTSFSYQAVIPTLTTYLERSPKKIRLAILLGSALPFLAYVVWGFLLFGMVPLGGEHGLRAAKEGAGTPIEMLRILFPGTPLPFIGECFAFFALTTSFLGVTLGLLDFLADGLQIQKVGWRKVLLCVFVYLPPFCISVTNPSLFLRALGYGGGIGCMLLLGLLPIVLVWVGRYRGGYGVRRGEWIEQLGGGKIALFLLALFVFFELTVEWVAECI